MLTSRQIKNLQEINNPLIKQRYIKYFQLPQDLRKTIFSGETADKIMEIAKKNNLNDSQIWWASYITGMILLGETNIVDFLKSIEKECNLERELARRLARDINSIVFLPHKEDLKRIHKIQEWPRENKEPSAPQLNGNVVNLKEKQ